MARTALRSPGNLLGDCVRRHKKLPKGMSQWTVCEEWRLVRRQRVRNDDAVRPLEGFPRPNRETGRQTTTHGIDRSAIVADRLARLSLTEAAKKRRV